MGHFFLKNWYLYPYQNQSWVPPQVWEWWWMKRDEQSYHLLSAADGTQAQSFSVSEDDFWFFSLFTNEI